MKKSFYVFLIMGFMFSLISCSTPEEKAYKEVYELAKKDITDKLKAPSSAKFQDLSDIVEKKYVLGTEPMTIAEAAPDLETGNPKIDSVRALQLDGVKVDYCTMDIAVEAQNSFGVMIKDTWEVVGRKLNYKDGKDSKWTLIGTSSK